MALTFHFHLKKSIWWIYIVWQALFFPALASGPISLSEAPPLVEASAQAKDIKKVAKLLENPEERAKLLETLKVLAAAQEAEEKKKGASLVSYITPVIQEIRDRTVSFLKELKKIPNVFKKFIGYTKVETNRGYIGTALLWFPLLLGVSFLFETLQVWFLKRWLRATNQAHMMIHLKQSAQNLINSKSAYGFFTLFIPFLYSLLVFPLLAPNHDITNWLSGFLISWFIIRLFLLIKKPVPLINLLDESKQEISLRKRWLENIAAGFMMTLFLGTSFMVIVNPLAYGEGFLINILLFMAYPLLILYFLEWRTQERAGYIEDSKSLSTVPLKVAPFINFIIYSLPWFLIFMGVLLMIDRVFYEGSAWKNYAGESIASLLIFEGFLIGRRYINQLTSYRIQKFKAPRIQAFISYISPSLFAFSKGLQWVLYLSFLILLTVLWNSGFSSLFADLVSNSLIKTGVAIGLIWGITYLLWLGLDFFVQFRIKPQVIKGKKREPTIFAKTFGPMLQSVARWIMILIAILVTLESLGFDLKILVYLMSAFALAISLGAQNLVKDVINGFFALIDGSFAAGEVVTVGPHTGSVESLSLRALTLRHGDGSLQVIPFSEVGNIINRSRDYTIVPISVVTSYKTRIGKVYDALNKAAQEIGDDPIFGKMILEPLSISGIDRFAETAVYVSASIKIVPDPKNYFIREFNRRLKTHLDVLGIMPPIAFQEKWADA